MILETKDIKVNLEVSRDINKLTKNLGIFHNKEVKKNKSVIKAIEHGHYTILEPISVEINIKDIPVDIAVHFIRHCDLKFQQMSHRESHDNYNFYFPKDRYKNLEDIDLILKTYDNHIKRCIDLYETYLKLGVDPEDARFVLPKGLTTNLRIIGTLNHIYFMLMQRFCYHAQYTTQKISEEIFKKLKTFFPEISKHFSNRCYNYKKICKKCIRE